MAGSVRSLHARLIEELFYFAVGIFYTKTPCWAFRSASALNINESKVWERYYFNSFNYFW